MQMNQVFDVDENIVDGYRKLEMNWTDIANVLNTTTKTLGKWRKRKNYEVILKVIFSHRNKLYTKLI